LIIPNVIFSKPDILLHSDRIHCYKRQTIKYTIHNDELNE
jgi:hypothetical protein